MEKAIKKIEDSIRKRDKAAFRSAVIDMLDRRAGKKATLEAVGYAVGKGKDLFDADDGSLAKLDRGSWNPGYCELLKQSLGKNFSREKLQEYAEVCVEMAGNAEARKRADEVPADAESLRVHMQETGESGPLDGEPGAEEPAAGESVVVSEELAAVEGRLMDIVEVSGPVEIEEPAASDASDANTGDMAGALTRKGNRNLKIFGYVVMLLGLAAAIVAISVPGIKWLVGLGIGVLMLGSVFVVLGIPKD